MLTTPDTIADGKLVYIKRCINDTIYNPEFVIHMRNVFIDVKNKDFITYLWRYNNTIQFITEIGSGDYCKDGLELIKSKYGDCEDFTVFNISMFKLYGVKCRIKVTDTFNQGYYTHILSQFYDFKTMSWVSFDGTYRMKGIGGEPIHFKEKYYHI